MGHGTKNAPPAFLEAGGKAEDGAPVHPTLPPWRRLWRIVHFAHRDLASVVAFSIAVGILSLAAPLMVQQLVNFVAFGALLTPLVVLSILLFVFLAFAAILKGMQIYLVEILQRRLFVRVVGDLAWRLPRVRVETFDRAHGPELVNRFFDVMTVQKTGATLLLDGLSMVLTAVIGLIVLAFYHPILLAFDLFLLCAIAFILFVLGRGAVNTAIVKSRAKYAVAAWLEEMARHPLAFKHAGGAAFALMRADERARQYVLLRRRHYRKLFSQIIGALALQVLASTALLGIGGWLVMAGQLTLGQLVAAELIVTVVVVSFANLGKSIENFYNLMAAVEKLGHLMDLPLERADGERPPELNRAAAAIRFHNVSFGYGGGPAVLDGLALDIRAGDRLAILGSNGSGKTTLVDLLFGLREPSLGHIEIDGWDLRDLSREALREQVGTVKGLEIVEGTIAENVAMGREQISLADVRAALRAACLLDAAQSMPDGLQTHLAASGSPLSSGQAARLMLARAIVGRPRLLVLDEAIDEIDQEIRDQVISALIDRQAPWTLILLTHSYDLARRCDRIVRLEDGRAVESGTTPRQTSV
jgi:putative ABC transport system ATP-binding protein